ncbi:MAG: Choline-sulfatase [uncultured Rubrobacteraceae bacterium]|uniref:Choline-sulfatase n=1 Tax=uncultured Rubrobacteraceae bacterium TaxID=349277 RepID=A0A6J4PVF1_9ACTN|nr:MAG: Choline-sulfatase [uncultured Rubrobacteraceae bacterium]
MNPASHPKVGTTCRGPGTSAVAHLLPLAVLAVLGLLGCAPSEETTASDSPNVLLVLTDDQPATTVRHMPKLGEFVGERGLTFERAYLADPLCCPSRATILTGKYTHNHRITNNHHRKGGARQFREEGLHRDTIGTRLEEAGYATGYFGKWMNGYEGRHVPPGWGRWFAFSGDLNRLDSYEVNADGQRRVFPREQNETDLLRKEAEDFVRDHRDEPWMALVATHAPHGPYWPPERHEGSFDGVKLPRTPAFDEDDVSGKPEAYRRPPLSDQEKRQLRRSYEGKLEALQGVDDLVGGLVGVLKETGQLENTYVVYLTDNGYLLGEHRHEAKGKPYEGSIRTPLLVRGPGVPAGESRGQIVANVDLAPTIAGWTGASPPENPDGRSLAPLLTSSPSGSWRKALLIEHFVGSDWTGLRTRTHTYVEHEGGDKELYDMRKDHYQLENIHDRADDALLNTLEERLQDLKDCAGAQCREAER